MELFREHIERTNENLRVQIRLMILQKDLRVQIRLTKCVFFPKYFKLHLLLSVLMTCLTIFSVPDCVFCAEGESMHMEATEHKYKTKLTSYLVSLIKAIFKRLFYQFAQTSTSFCSIGDF